VVCYFVLHSLCVMCSLLFCSFVCCVLFEHGVLLRVAFIVCNVFVIVL
jgi:hypothetical protein